MAVDIDEQITPLTPAAVRADLAYLATVIGLVISTRPTDPTYQLMAWIARWFCRLWNRYAIPALRGQFGATAAGVWLTAWAAARGVSRPLATFGSGDMTFENRSGVGVDISAPGAVSWTNAGGYTFVSQGPAPGSTGTVVAAIGTTYAQTTLVMVATQTGSASNTAPGAAAGYPATPASAPAGIYVATGASSPPSPNGPLLGSDAMLDPALYALTLAAQALSSSPGSPVSKYLAVVLNTLLNGVSVSTSRIQSVGNAASVTVWCATRSGPTPGNASDPTTELGAINSRVQLQCAQPGLTITVAAATPHGINLGNVVLFVTAESGVTSAQAIATATAAFALWQSLLAVGGERIVGGGTGFVLLNALMAALQSQINPSYPAQWLPNTYYFAGDEVSNAGLTFVASSPGTSSTTPPDGDGGPDGATGLEWTGNVALGSGSQFTAAPGVYEAAVGGIGADVALSIGDVAVITWTAITAQIVPQH